MRKLLVIVAGPTASGKTALAVDLAIHFKTEIVSADSRQFFTELTIGTAKPGIEILDQVPHHFINSHSVAEPFNAGMFAAAALPLLEKLFLKHQVLILCGGSGLYIDALIFGMNELPAASVTIRDELNLLYKTKGIAALQEMLREKDPEAFIQIDIQNPRRLMRALEVFLSSGKTWSSQIKDPKPTLPYDFMMAGISWPREALYERINKRVQLMMEAGLVEEAKRVLPFREMNALQTVGYNEIFSYLDGKYSLEDAAHLIAKNSRNYAKRQLTWFRKYREMIWIDPGQTKELIAIVEEKLRAI